MLGIFLVKFRNMFEIMKHEGEYTWLGNTLLHILRFYKYDENKGISSRAERSFEFKCKITHKMNSVADQTQLCI